MSIEIEMRGVRWRSVGGRVSVASAADRRMQVGQAFLPAQAPPGQSLRYVWPKRSDQPSRTMMPIDPAGGAASNLRTEHHPDALSPVAGTALDAKD